MLDVYIPSASISEHEPGEVHVYFSSPGAGLDAVEIGEGELGGLPIGQFTTLRFALPGRVAEALEDNHDDVTIKIDLEVDTRAGDWLLSNLRFTTASSP
jgi:hypothetical protein